MTNQTNPSDQKPEENEQYNLLLLDNQLCFSLYVCSKEIIRRYKPLLDPYGLTYTGYIILMALWEKDNITVKELGERLYLDSGTLTPMLKKLEAQNYIKRTRSLNDERNVFIQLGEMGRSLRKEALSIPKNMICTLNLDSKNSKDLIQGLHNLMHQFDSEA